MDRPLRISYDSNVAVERGAGRTSFVDVFDRVLDKGIVIDAWVRVSLVGIDLTAAKVRIVAPSRSDAGEGSTGAAEVLDTALEPRRRAASKPQRTRRRERH
jgi:hypothetical protein